ncbi:MAG: iron complex outermembrane recepter protein [Marinobacter excellens HL-55]|uniref:Iron complex outermembrane recepter protein n=1 Tax=Marinobacter excellens HL-55 TaxID=1305731 RepID=A0A0P7ZL75_9GAMM|nr:MAG: iron complex outermembrane recepter protein [Marinobacter excellens HL-55]
MLITNYLSANRSSVRSSRIRFPLSLLASALISMVAIDAGAEMTPQDFDPALVAFGDDIPEVLTTTRLRQPKTRVPGTTTVITGDMIRDLGIMNLYEVFRLVPGMVVNFVGSHQPVTTYHGTVHYEQRRMQVLVDGRTSHKATLSDMDWETMPVPLEMIERIEVARGPNSAAYGINAFLGTINIITRDPADTAGVETRVVSGSRGYLRTFGSVGNAGPDLDWRLTYEKRKFDGFDYQVDDGEELPFRNGHDINSFTYDSRLKFDEQMDLELRVGMVDGTKYNDKDKTGELNPFTDPDIDVRDYYVQSKLNISTSDRHFFHVMAAVENFNRRQPYTVAFPDEAVACLASETPLFRRDSNRDFVCFPDDASMGGFAEVDADSEDTRLELELQDSLIITNDIKMVSGAGFRKDTYRSETYFNGRGNNYQSRFFGNLEYTPLSWLTLNAGGNWERTSTTDNSYFSPRLAANFTLNNRHALRLVYSEAVRTPDGFEQNPDWGYTLKNVRPSQYSNLEGRRITAFDAYEVLGWLTLDKDLDEERITSREISYFGQFPLEQAMLSVEVRGFKDDLRDMISGVIQLKDWSVDNNVAIDQKGFEVEASLEFPGTLLRTSYGYLDQHTRYTGEPIINDDGDVDTRKQNQAVALLTRMSVRHSGSVAVIHDLPWGLKASSAFYWADEFGRSQFERIDARIAKRIYQPRYTAELAFTMQHYMNRDPELSSDNNIKNHNQFFVEAGVRF